MPLFNYECQNESCGFVIEKFLHHRGDEPELVCPECGCEEFERIMGDTHSRTRLNAKETFNERIVPDVDRICDNMCKGSEKDFLDIAGD